MKKEFKDLSIEEFVRVICNVPKKHTIKIQSFNTETGEGLGDERDLITGDYWTLYRYFSIRSKDDDEQIRLCSNRMLYDLEKSYFDYEVEYSSLDIYAYLDNKTVGFDKERCNILFWDMLFYKYYIANELDKCEITEERFFYFSEAITILLSKNVKLNDESLQQGKQPPTLPEELDTPRAKEWLQRAIDGGLLNDDYTTTGKVSTKPQKALLAEILSQGIGIKNKWDVFQKLWGVSGLAKKRYKSKEETGKVCGGEFIEAVFAG